MVDKKLENFANRLGDSSSLRSLFAHLNYDFAAEPVNKENWKDEERKVIEEALIIAKKGDYKIYYLQTKTDSLKHWKGISTKIIKENHGLCLICSHNPSGFKWVFSSLSKEFSKSFSETRHIPLDIKPQTGVPNTFLEFLEKVKVGSDDTETSIRANMSDAFDLFAVEIHDELTVNVFEALKTLSEGIVKDTNNKMPLTNEILEEIREPSFILLYRIIFILYAEDRGIFPIDHSIYRDEFSLKWIKEKWLLRSFNSKKINEYQIQDRIKKLFRLIEVGSEELDYKKEEFFMRSYYGRIFDRKLNHKLEEWKIPNSNFLEVLSRLTRIKDKKGNYFFLDYSALETRHLGSIYEHLLEFHLHVKSKKISELPDAKERKTTGSYYTPKYVVDYIVKNSIEPSIESIIEENPDKQLQIEKILSLKILDPAMGSGHFLVSAVEYIAKRLCEIEYDEIPEQSYIERKRDVVRRCIYGVDINPLAVDLASLSLWLETLSSEKPLSFLSAHLKCGNSLLGTKIELIFGKQTTLFESEKGRGPFIKNLKKFLMFENLEDDSPSAVKMKLEEYTKMQAKGTIYYELKFLLDSKISELFGIKIPNLGDYRAKVGENSLDFYTNDTYQSIKKLSEENKFFHWGLEFPQIFYDENGNKKTDSGFDCIIGNPPYVRQEKLTEELKSYLEKNFQTYAGTADLFVYFIERSLKFLKNDEAYLGIIVSNKWFKRKYGKELRKFLKNFWVEEIVDFGVLQIFKGATTYPCIFIIKNIIKKNPKISICHMKEIPNDLQKYVEENKIEFPQTLLTDEGWDLKDPKLIELIEKIKERTTPLKKFENIEFYRGVTTGLNEAFVITKDQYDKLVKEDPKSKEIIFPHITGKEVKRHHINWNGDFLIFTKRGIDIEKFPAIKKHLLKFKEKLTPKKSPDSIGRKPGKYKWFEIQDSTAYWNIFLEEGIVYPDINQEPNFAINDKNYFPNASLYQIKSNDLWLLSILNSNIINSYLKKICPDLQGGYYDYKSVYIEKVPIPKKKKHEKKIKELAKKMIQLKISNRTEYDELGREINQLIYDEYDLKQNDIEIIERNLD